MLIDIFSTVFQVIGTLICAGPVLWIFLGKTYTIRAGWTHVEINETKEFRLFSDRMRDVFLSGLVLLIFGQILPLAKHCDSQDNKSKQEQRG